MGPVPSLQVLALFYRARIGRCSIVNLLIMKFPGQRKSKHYFPVSLRDPLLQPLKKHWRMMRIVSPILLVSTKH